jgi:lipoprotein-anchoring transpeptidase ErfK/SrfK
LAEANALGSLRRSARLCLASGPLDGAEAETFRLENPNDSVVGVPFYFKARAKDTLLDIARQNNLGYDDMRQANPSIDIWVPGEGTPVMVPAFYVLPDAPRTGIVVNRAEKRLYYFPPNDPNEVRIYAITVGRDAMGTPLGSFKVIEKRKDPTWTPGPMCAREPCRPRRYPAADGTARPRQSAGRVCHASEQSGLPDPRDQSALGPRDGSQRRLYPHVSRGRSRNYMV